MRAVIGGVFVLFAALNVYAFEAEGLKGLWQALTLSNAWQKVLCVDLVISLSLVLTWLWRDARAHGRSPLPYVFVTLLTGSIGPLWYLLRRPAVDRAAAAADDEGGVDAAVAPARL
ncbi:MAG: DUF2834 domain-containing protein [Polyangia bacterium]